MQFMYETTEQGIIITTPSGVVGTWKLDNADLDDLEQKLNDQLTLPRRRSQCRQWE
jgi:hypothetical protein